MNENFRPIKEILEDFAKPIDPSLIKQKPTYSRGQQSNYVDYLPWYEYIKLLVKYAPGYSWEVDLQFTESKVIAKGKLVIRAKEGEFLYSEIGVEDLGSDGYGDSCYNASSSSLRRSCARAGLSLELWDKDNKKVSSIPKSEFGPFNSRKAIEKPTIKPKEVGSDLITEEQRKDLFKAARSRGLSNEEVKDIIGSYGFISSSQIVTDKYSDILDDIKKASSDLITEEQRRDLFDVARSKGMSKERLI